MPDPRSPDLPPRPSLPAAVLSAFRLDAAKIRAEKLDGGFSGALLYRLRHAGGAGQGGGATGAPKFTVLRRWPQGTAASRVREVQTVTAAARRRGCTLVPATLHDADEVVAADGYLWQHSDWVPGVPCAFSPAEPEAFVCAIGRAAAAVGRFHAAVADLTPHTAASPHAEPIVPAHSVGPPGPPAVIQRYQRLRYFDDWLPRSDSACGSASAPAWALRAEATLRMLWPRHVARLQAALRNAHESEAATPLQYVLRDCHHGHILFDRDRLQVTGLIDFDALRIDTPATDLGRLVFSFAACTTASQELLGGEGQGENVSQRPISPAIATGLEAADAQLDAWRNWLREALWPAAVAGIRQECSFSDQQANLAIVLGEATTLLALANWVKWTKEACSTDSPPGPARLDSIRNRVEALSQFAINYFSSALS
ncbi:aminoglycoside phosphotransferase family protein [Roseimaritima sediminicola]|uniref:aminoglycoside phosphotransferase family protein n=1 Tax=Roseimaritima sediminicola TaxID=2662066 RepID=UPI00129856B1|nr:aminoglycoside phosphotransferase family protein [Roseimaritima sediminicola]